MKTPEKMIRWIMLTNFVSNTAYSVCAPFLPLEFERHGLNGFYVGITFALYSLGTMFMSILIGKQVDRIGAANLLGFGIVLMGVSFVLFGLIQDMENRVNILALAFTLRLLHGVGCSTSYTTLLSIATNDFPEDRARVVGYLQAMTGAGGILGPIIGSFLYSFLGFKYTFFVYGGFEVLLGIFIRFNLPERNVHRSKLVDEPSVESLIKSTSAVRESEADAMLEIRSSFLH